MYSAWSSCEATQDSWLDFHCLALLNCSESDCTSSCTLQEVFGNPETPECGGNSDEKEGDMSVTMLDSFLCLNVMRRDHCTFQPPPPQKRIRDNFPIIPISNKVCFLELKQLDSFVQQLNTVRSCLTPGCKGVLAPLTVKNTGLGSAVSICFSCNDCFLQHTHFESSV